MGLVALFPRQENNPRYDQDLMECRIVERDPVRIYSASGSLLREYPDVCELGIPESDRPVIHHQVMEQHRESDVAFSKTDLLLAAEYQFSEMRLIGRSYLFSVKPSGRNWPEPEDLARHYDEILNHPDLILLLERMSTSRELVENSWDPDIEILQIRNDLICKLIAAVYGLDYQKTEYACPYPYRGKAWGSGPLTAFNLWVNR